MKIIRQDQAEKPYCITLDSGAIIKAFYNLRDAEDFMDWLVKHPAAEDIIIAKS